MGECLSVHAAALGVHGYDKPASSTEAMIRAGVGVVDAMIRASGAVVETNIRVVEKFYRVNIKFLCLRFVDVNLLITFAI